MTKRFLIHHRQVDRVTVAAQTRVLDVLVESGIDSKRLLHRVRRDFLVFKGSEHLFTFADRELPGYPMLQEKMERVLPGWRFIFDYVMTGGAAHSVASQRAVLEVLIRRLR